MGAEAEGSFSYIGSDKPSIEGDWVGRKFYGTGRAPQHFQELRFAPTRNITALNMLTQGAEGSARTECGGI
jgi:hypothetical protein